jgi:hypothetical protein
MSDWAAMIDGVQPALAGLDMNMPGFFAYVSLPSLPFTFILFASSYLLFSYSLASSDLLFSSPILVFF